jgi:hypothetical protein
MTCLNEFARVLDHLFTIWDMVRTILVGFSAIQLY